MSLAIDVGAVRAVLLADGWHKIADNSLSIDSYEYVQGGLTTQGSGNGVSAAGFRFKDEAGYILHGPLTAILASRTA